VNTLTAPKTIDVVELAGAGRRYGEFWALRDVTLSLPAGSITAVVGPNGAGKTTLLNLLVGLLPLSEGSMRVVGEEPNSRPDFLARVGFVAQDCPLYKEFTVTDLLRFGRSMNPVWDDEFARDRLRAADVPLTRKAGRLSGGQRAQTALALAVAKRPRVLLLDEPLAALDPIARRTFLKNLIESVTSTGLTVILSSHLIGDLARVADQLVVIQGGRLTLSGELDELLAQHRWVAGPADQLFRLPKGVVVIADERHERHSRMLVRSPKPLLNPDLTQTPVALEELVLAYLERATLTTATGLGSLS
jgi:ABC-2 type transport system ATP-binding protein